MRSIAGRVSRPAERSDMVVLAMHESARPALLEPLLGRNKEFDALYAQYWAELCSYVRKRFGPGPPEPEDIVQEAFIRFAALDDADRIDDRTPERVLESKERLSVLAKAILAMPAPRRRSLLLNRLHGLSCAEIARRTGYSESAVKKHIAVALADLEAECEAAEQCRERSLK
jgi:DNA-directed RNA polymerase specialized sigma24 family protein